MLCLTVPVWLAALHLPVASPATVKKCYPVDDKLHCFQTDRNIRRSWHEAKDYCENVLSDSYSLAATNDRRVYSALEQFLDLSDFISDYIWIGVTRTTRAQWFWVDGSRYTGALHSTTDNQYYLRRYRASCLCMQSAILLYHFCLSVCLSVCPMPVDLSKRMEISSHF